ncbi:hypothetical protein KCP74_24140 [Salmonella enterica subsp. enterica]|nr:hypothetical protein KCP74_24140 [Salmonella enterica subsp. enterica]
MRENSGLHRYKTRAAVCLPSCFALARTVIGGPVGVVGRKYSRLNIHRRVAPFAPRFYLRTLYWTGFGGDYRLYSQKVGFPPITGMRAGAAAGRIGMVSDLLSGVLRLQDYRSWGAAVRGGADRAAYLLQFRRSRPAATGYPAIFCHPDSTP